MGNKTKHLEMIQGVINRLSTNSFQLKGWSVVLVSALFALSAPTSDQSFIFLAYFPAAIFWGLMVTFFGRSAYFALSTTTSESSMKELLIFQWIRPPSALERG